MFCLGLDVRIRGVRAHLGLRASIPELLQRAVDVGLLQRPADVDRTTAGRALRRLDVRTRTGTAPSLDSRRFAKENRMQIVLRDGKHFRAGRQGLRRVAISPTLTSASSTGRSGTLPAEGKLNGSIGQPRPPSCGSWPETTSISRRSSPSSSPTSTETPTRSSPERTTTRFAGGAHRNGVPFEHLHDERASSRMLCRRANGGELQAAGQGRARRGFLVADRLFPRSIDAPRLRAAVRPAWPREPGETASAPRRPIRTTVTGSPSGWMASWRSEGWMTHMTPAGRWSGHNSLMYGRPCGIAHDAEIQVRWPFSTISKTPCCTGCWFTARAGDPDRRGPGPGRRERSMASTAASQMLSGRPASRCVL